VGCGGLALAGLVAVTPAALAAGAALDSGSAQTTEAPTLQLVEQAPWVPMGFDAEFVVAASAPPDAEVTLTVHARVDDRDELLESLGGEDLGPVLGRRTSALSELPRGVSGDRTLRIGTQLPGAEEDRDRVQLESTGVYPVRIVVTDTQDRSADLVTFLVAVDTAQRPQQLPLALVVPVQAAPVELPDGSSDDDVLDEMRPGGRLDRIVDELSESSTAASLALGPETAQSWVSAGEAEASIARGVEALRDAVDRPRREVLSAPYARLDLPALVANGLEGEITTQVGAGTEVLESALGARVDPRQQVVDPADSGSLDALRRDLFVDRVVVPAQALADLPEVGTRGGLYRLETDAGDATAALSDSYFATIALLDGEAPLQAQRLLAAIAVDATSDPTSAGAVVTFPHDWNPVEGVLGTVLDGVEDNPLVTPLTLAEWFDRVPEATDEGGETTTVTATSIDTGRPPVSANQLEHARFELSTLRSLVGQSSDVRRGERAILRAPSADLVGSTGEARVAADLARISQDAQSFLSGITTDEKSVTLTGRDATIPVTVRNSNERPVRVRLDLQSSKLLFPEGSERIVPVPAGPEGTATVRVAVESRASGTFPLFVTLTTDDEVFQIGPTRRITVRTTVFGGVAGWISVGAAGFLGIWWARHAWRSRRRTAES
jgi:hypothetical protein